MKHENSGLRNHPRAGSGSTRGPWASLCLLTGVYCVHRMWRCPFRCAGGSFSRTHLVMGKQIEKEGGMTHQLVCVAIVSLLSAWTAPIISLNSLAEAQGAECASASEQSSERIWIERGPEQFRQGVQLEVRCAEEYSADAAVLFDCFVRQYDESRTVDKLHARLVIQDRSGTTQYKGEVLLFLREGQDSCQFTWDASTLSPGAYTARFEWRDRPEYSLGWSEYIVRKVSPDELEEALERSGEQVGALRARLDDLAAEGRRPPYLWMEIAMAEDFLAFAKADFAYNNWRRVDSTLRYIRQTAESVRTHLTFSNFAPELNQPIPEPDLSTLEVRDGALYAEGRPVFLLGWCSRQGAAEDMPRLRRYGLNLVVVDISPRDTLLSERDVADIPALLDPVFRRAEECNISVIVDLSPDAMPAWAIEKWPEMADDDLGGINVTGPAARTLLERHLRALLPYLAEQKMLNSVCLLDRPRFRFEGEAVRKGFLATVKELYADRHALNRSWKAHLASFDDIDITGGHLPHEYQEKRAFQYDWQTYNQRLGTEFLTGVASLARELAPDVPSHVKCADTVFEPGESRRGVDHETLSKTMDFAGCTVKMTSPDPHYAMEYPRQALCYTFLRSLAPEKPVVNLENRIVSSNKPSTAPTGAYVHSVMWDGAISGLSASAAWGWDWSDDLTDVEDSVLMRPECLEGYARACLDLNRLGEIVVAFQQAPADVAVLWSLPSKILHDGTPYLSSTRDAFEGCSFSGYKVRFVTQSQCVATGLAGVKVLVISETPALSDETFKVLQDYVREGGAVARISTPIPYNERGHSRHDSIGTTKKIILVRGVNLPTEYLHAMDAVFQLDVLEPIPRAVNPYGYPLEGVKTCYVELDGDSYLYLLNLRKETTVCHLTGVRQAGRDLIQGRSVAFPMMVDPLDPMLIRLDAACEEVVRKPGDELEAEPKEAPVIELQPVAVGP